MPTYARRMSTVPGGRAGGSGRRTMWVAARKSVDRRCTSIIRVLAAGRTPADVLLLAPLVAQETRAGSTRAAAAEAGISTAGRANRWSANAAQWALVRPPSM